ncbi:DUF3991 and TOPRIM domain-containing protein [Oscillibacter sp. 1-3]|uniref:DUF3991 and TOPRIM domain-containing protein n=1 Tax=Oscillibacter sp. 1-3 TaxID=1235797 RepID=UPI0003386B9B|nr:DUF3991 and TOPRIM domain-containing protein [Oscillibacter sp. 1-3]EOS66316.1 hypothetical protein C816_01362 [Oscillibacter sp. 1-3]
MNANMAYGFTETELDITRHTDLPDLLSSLGYTLKRIGSYYTTAEMDSIRIKERLTWRRYSTRQGGDAISFLQEFCGMRFPEAVDYLLAYHGRSRDSPDRDKPIPRPKTPPPREKPPFVLPPANPDQRRVFAYLRKRGIASQVIQRFLDAGLLYEDAPYHNCVFVGRDGSGQPKFASKRGTLDFNGSGFKRDVLGSDKKVGFRLPCEPEIEEVAVFEAPIDLMSFCTLCPEVHSNAVALCGLYSGPLDTYLRDHPHLKSIKLLLDHDEPGITAAKEMREKYRAAGYEVEIRVPKYGKDWNAQLKYKLTGVLEEVKPPKSTENPTKKEETKPMANLGKIISDKSTADAKWREERQADKETAAALRDASVIQITKDPGKFARYLAMQGDNPSYSSGNIALAMAQLPEATVLHTRGHWKDLGRFVLDPELKNGASIFTRSATGRGYSLTSVYDIAQTQGRELRTVQLKEDTEPMEAALTALLNFSPVQVVAGENLPSGAYYDPRQMTLAIDTACPDGQAFAAIAAEIAQARFHDRGRNPVYSRESCELSAQSVSYILCRRFGVQRELPDLTKMAERCQGWEIEDRLAFLKEIQGMSRQIGGSIEKTIAPPQRAAPSRREAER